MSAKNVQLRFSGRRFLIEQATLVVYKNQFGTPTTTTGQPLYAGAARGGLQSSPQVRTYRIVNSVTTVPLDGPGPIHGILFLPTIRRVSDGLTIDVLFARFDHDVGEHEWLVGAALIDFESYSEVRIRIRDDDGRPLARRTLGLAYPGGAEEGMDLQTDENGEVKMLVAPGKYALGAGSGTLQMDFDITTSEGEQVIPLSMRKDRR